MQYFSAILYTGIGDIAVNRFFAALNLPSVVAKTLKKCEREVGSAFEAVAESTCQEAIEKEINWYLKIFFLNENIIKCYFPNTCINYNYMNIATFFFDKMDKDIYARML